ncbi:hypothetical protein IMY05_007G0053900 [Salix suchowensis]|nr:hypothetical protein IMY05_007G0053900 [Salix suchowensis]
MGLKTTNNMYKSVLEHTFSIYYQYPLNILTNYIPNQLSRIILSWKSQHNSL